MRILHVLERSLPTVGGYTARAASILEHQAAIGLAPRAVTGVRGGSGATEFIGGIEHLRTRPPGALALLEGAPALRGAVEMAALGRRILAIHREEPFELIHAHSPVFCGLAAHAAARRLAVPSVYEIRAFREDDVEERGQGRRGSAGYVTLRALETRLARSADAVVTVSEGLRRDLLARGVPGDRLFVVPDGVDTERFAPRPRDEELAHSLGFHGKSVIAYVGALSRFEGVGLLLEALGRLCDARDDLRGLIVGAGEAEAELRDHCDRLGLAGRVVLTGKVPYAEVPRYYAVSDVLCYPRERHRITELVTPRKPLEAMSMGKAVVGSDVGGLRELVNDGETGLLFRAGDAAALASVLGRLVGDDQLRRRLGERARARVAASLSWSTLVARYLDVYAAATERRIEASC